MAWDFSCIDWEDRITDGRSLVPHLPLDEKLAIRAIEVFNSLKLPDVPGTPALEQASGEWFREILTALFGSIVDSARLVRELFLMIPKKNSKTTNGAAMMLTAQMMNRRPRAEFLLIGPTQAISELAFNQAVGMIGADAELSRRFRIQEHVKKITYRGSVVSSLQIKTFDASVLTGVKPVGVLIDELHELGKISGAANVIRQIRGGLLPFPEAFLAFITTQSDKPPAGAFKAELLKARKIRDGKIPARGMLPVLYEFPRVLIDNGAWRDPTNWPMVNPNVGRSITVPRLIEDYETALETGDEELRGWASQHLDIEIGLALHTDRWAGADYWEACGDPTLTFESLIERSDVIVVGIDGGGLDDLLGTIVLGRDAETQDWLVWAKAWAHRSVFDRRKSDVAPRLLDFQKDGDLVIVKEVGDDVAELGDLVEKIWLTGKMPEEHSIGVDQYCISAIVEEIARRDIDTEKAFVGVPQGWKLTGAITTTARQLAGKKLVHAAQPLMAWCVGNAKVEPKGNAITITKQAAGTAKIDPLMALFDAAVVIGMNPTATSSIYDREPGRSFLVL